MWQLVHSMSTIVENSVAKISTWINNPTMKKKIKSLIFAHEDQRYKYRVLQTIQMKLILLCVLAEPAVLGSTKTALKFKYEI